MRAEREQVDARLAEFVRLETVAADLKEVQLAEAVLRLRELLTMHRARIGSDHLMTTGGVGRLV